jgi:hypothetical protein
MNTPMYRKRNRDTRVLLKTLIGICAIVMSSLLSVGCKGEPTVSTIQPDEELFWSLTLNHRAVNLSLTDPYDTVRLIATARNIHGTPFPDAPLATLTSESESVLVFPDGRIKALGTTGAGGIRVIASLTYRGVTREDTAWVCVTNLPNPPVMDTFQFRVPEGDSTYLPLADFFGISSGRKTLTSWLYTREGPNAYPTSARLLTHIESSNPNIATLVRQSNGTWRLDAMLPGTVMLYATTMAYGVARRDPIEFTIRGPVLGLIALSTNPKQISPGTITISRGGEIIWYTESRTDSVDIVFEHPEQVDEAKSMIGRLLMEILDAPLDRAAAEGGIGPFAGANGSSKIGERVLDPRLTMSADPMDPDLGFPPFDRGGNVYHPVNWIENGVLKELAYYRPYGIRELGINRGLPNSRAYRLSGGTTSIEEMIASTKRGLLVTRFYGITVLDHKSLLCSGYTRDGLWLVENGKITKAVKNFRITESPLFIFNNVEALGVPVRAFRPSEPAVVPPALVRDFSFTSLSEAV